MILGYQDRNISLFLISNAWRAFHFPGVSHQQILLLLHYPPTSTHLHSARSPLIRPSIRPASASWNSHHFAASGRHVVSFLCRALKLVTDRQFLSKWRNLIDLAILAVLIIILIIELVSQDAYNIAEEIGTLVLIARYGLQLYRIGSLVWQSKEVGLLRRL